MRAASRWICIEGGKISSDRRCCLSITFNPSHFMPNEKEKKRIWGMRSDETMDAGDYVLKKKHYGEAKGRGREAGKPRQSRIENRQVCRMCKEDVCESVSVRWSLSRGLQCMRAKARRRKKGMRGIVTKWWCW
jgi:hypothetical protein